MTPRHVGARLSLNAFAARAGLAASTLRGYISRNEAEMPPPCGKEQVSGQRWWCERHADAWINRPKRRPNPTKPKPEE